MYYQIKGKASRQYAPSREVARYIAGRRAGTLPPDVQRATQRAILDLLGAALAGAVHADVAPPVLQYLKARGGAPEASLWVDGTRVPAEMATFWAACAGHALELDDGHREGAVHIGTVVVPVALCLGEFLGSSGSQVLAAVAAGYEVMGRVAAGINPSHFLRGFHTTGCTGPFGAVAAAAVLLGLDEAQALGALGTAGVQFAGLLEVVHTGQMVKGIQVGRAAEAGVMAARLALAGVAGPEAILEGPKAFVHAMTDEVDWDRMLDGLGRDQPAEVMKAYTKPYPSCRHCHPVIDLALMLHQQMGPLTADRICAIKVRSHSVALAEVGQILLPASNQEAKFSAAWNIASALVLGRVGLDEVADQGLRDPARRALASAVTFELDPERDRAYPRSRGASMEVLFHDGRRWEQDVTLPKGEPETALTDDALAAKFRSLAVPVIGQDRAERVISLVWNLEEQQDLKGLMALLARSA